jgi:hypothetical protein
MPYWLGLFVLRRTCRQNRLYETLFHTVIILSKHHHHSIDETGPPREWNEEMQSMRAYEGQNLSG